MIFRFLPPAETELLEGISRYVSALVNPEAFGPEKTIPSKWSDSAWHPKRIGSDKARSAFVENFKQLSDQTADNARATLKDRKPVSASLPALEGLRVNCDMANAWRNPCCSDTTGTMPVKAVSWWWMGAGQFAIATDMVIQPSR